jgi:2-iminobutanoate/2-iminopropanoate deaminase
MISTDALPANRGVDDPQAFVGGIANTVRVAVNVSCVDHYPLIVPVTFPVTIRHMKKPIFTSEAPAAIGPYSQGMRTGRFLFCSGQIPLDPKSGEIVSGDIATQTRRVLDNIAAILRMEGLTFDHVVKTTIFLTNLGDFQVVNETYGSYFKKDPPARSTVQVSALPRGANVEIEVIAAAAETDQTAYDTSG